MRKLLKIILPLSFSLFLISLSVNMTLSFKQLYYYDIENLNISQSYGMSKDLIIKNYDILIDYLKDKNIEKLNMPNFSTSKEGEIHFIEVKNIFTKFNTLMYFCAGISLIGMIYMIRKRSFSFLKYSSILLLALPAALSVPFAVNFDKSFTVFHKIFFNNDYWEFDPVKDPIINVLPQEFFLHNAVVILFLLVLFSFILYFIYRKSTSLKR